MTTLTAPPGDDFPMTRIQAARLDKGLTRDQLADQAGISANTLLAIESRKVRPSDETIFKLAPLVGVPASEIRSDSYRTIR